MLRAHSSPICETFRMNFVRSKRDARAMQSLMQEGVFLLRARNELRADVDLNSIVARDPMSRLFGALPGDERQHVRSGRMSPPLARLRRADRLYGYLG
jgi:hypothetical protein